MTATPQSAHVLVVEDDEAVRTALTRALTYEGYRVSTAGDGAVGLAQALGAEGKLGPPDVAVVDVTMPVLDGLEMCRRLRSAGSPIPVLILTARHEISDRVAGLDAGADDYLVKPFALDELLARLRALLRRSSVTGDDETLQLADLVVDPSRRRARRGDRELELTKTEFDLLALLVHNAGVVLTRDRIYQRIWGYDFETTSKSLDVYIGYLRRKTEAGGEARIIHTVRAVGYVARTPERPGVAGSEAAGAGEGIPG